LLLFLQQKIPFNFPSLDIPSPRSTPILSFQNQTPQPTITGIFPTMSPPIPIQTGPLIPTPQVVQTPQPVEIKPQIAWGKFNAYKEFGTGDKLLLGLDVDYPLNWKAQADVYNRIITFNEDPSGLVSFLVLPAWQGSWMDMIFLIISLKDFIRSLPIFPY